jgi:hypothetical protein
MPLMKGAELKYKYSWMAIPADDPRVSGKDGNTLFNRQDGYEVLSMINRVAAENHLKEKVLGHKMEMMIHDHLPKKIFSQGSVKKWLAQNWEKY